jgi:hypothetical protein
MPWTEAQSALLRNLAEEAMGRDIALMSALSVMIEHLDKAGVMSRAEFIGGLEVSLERNGVEMPPAARTQMEETLGVLRASDQT